MFNKFMNIKIDFESEKVGGMYTYLASENSLAKNWLSDKEDKAWAHLQKEK